MVGSSSRTSTVGSVSSHDLPRCGCGKTMKMWRANTVQNPNRKFLKCRNAGTGNSCELFLWDDEILHFSKGETVTSPFCKKCELLQMKLESVSNKLEKAKMKVEVQKRKNMQLRIALVVCCMIVGCIYNFM
ncbi:uncharacterized protein LOC131646906 [Vicia villosa]|uniref:uncharacterized protein LOC131646906 n=1 Tax=Vicia villosa TaxID=3911 RepID=UPI00273CB4CF|nr:uncharacterized protein LOC131646906 [Vicia villosa]